VRVKINNTFLQLLQPLISNTMLAVFIAYLVTLCAARTQSQMSLRDQAYSSGIKCIYTDVENECLTIVDSEGNVRCHWEDEDDDEEAHCSPIDFETSPPIDFECIYTNVENECVAIIDSEGTGRCHWEDEGEDAHCSPINYETSQSYDEELVEDKRKSRTIRGEEEQSEDENDDNSSEEEPIDSSEEDPGCCKGDAPETNDKCNDRIEVDKCQLDEKCQWQVGSEPDLCAYPAESAISSMENPSSLGCCYADAGAADKWADICTMASTDRECAEVTNGRDGDQRCLWESKEDGDDSDCATAKTLSPNGCCWGSTWQGECADNADQIACERKTCEWIETEDPNDCAMATTTSPPSTTEEEGCCLHRGNERKNMACSNKGSSTCERSGSCDWVGGDDPECAVGCCTSSVSEKMANRCAWLTTETGCVAVSDCEFMFDRTDCEWSDAPETTDEPWLGAKHYDAKHYGGNAESVLFENDRNIEVVQSLSSVSLSGVLLSMICAITTFTSIAVYRRREYIKVADASPMLCESV